MNKTLLKSVREYKKQSILAPILVILEVLMEVLIPMEMANIIDIGMTSGDLHYIIQRGVILVVMAMLSLFFGISAGNMAAVAGAGYAKNLRHDIFYKVQEFSFKNIDHFATSGLVTRMTTDITNIQMAYMMSIRLLARAPIMIITNTNVTIIKEPMICSAYTIILVNSPVPIVPWMIPVPPIATSRSITTYIVNCITGEFHATIFSAFVNSLYTYLEIP